MNLGDGFREALSRLEAGDDPDQIDEEMGDILTSEDPSGKAAPQVGNFPQTA